MSISPLANSDLRSTISEVQPPISDLQSPISESRPALRSSASIDILRFNTCGSVDDGKSTLIGRLLYDSKSIMEDQLEALARSADITGGGQINLANLTDGLRAEREQGISIDLAYRYFAK